MIAKPRARRGSSKLPRRRLFTTEEYERMIAAGILHEDEHVELLEGEILCMAPLGSKHAMTLDRLVRRFVRALPEDAAIVRVQEPIRLPPRAAPEPDLAIVRFRPDEYRDSHPNPEDVLLLIEVADTSFSTDRDLKLPRYAAAGISEVWLWDLPHEQVLVCREPKDGRYSQIVPHGRGKTLAPLAFPDLTIAIDDVLP